MYYQIIQAHKDEIGLAWQFVGNKPQVDYIYLPDSADQLKYKIVKDFREIKITARKIPNDIAEQIVKIYQGEKVEFDLSFLNISRLNMFAAKVLKQTCKIPRGGVDTYSGLALKIGSPGAARAVGTALANNPFPLVIPCHRVVRSDGSLGGFGGGIRMKKELLQKEGVVFDEKGHIVVK